MSDNFEDFYKLLGVSPAATQDEIKKAYLPKIREHHPDFHGGAEASDAYTKRLNVARDTLMDDARRADHDAEIRRRAEEQRRAEARRAEAPRRPAQPPRGPTQPSRRHVAEAPKSGSGWAWVAAAAATVFGVSVIASNANRWDSRMEQFRAKNGQFRGGRFD